MIEFAGWSMPLQYASIVEEHEATRNSCTITDVSHMGRFRFEGIEAGKFLDGLLTRRVLGMAPNQVRYSLITNEYGGVLDDVLVGLFWNPLGHPFYVLVVNAANRQKLWAWLHRSTEPGGAGPEAARILSADLTFRWAMFAIQGPASVEILQPLVDCDLRTIPYYHGSLVRLLHPAARHQGGILTRTGYTGEDGFELMVGAEIAAVVWEAILDLGKPQGIRPAGLGARDTLRLEAALPLYGHELNEEVNPLEAGLDFACQLEDRQFPGREALVAARESGLRRRLVCLALSGKRIARAGHPIFYGGQQVGVVTSGNFSPTLQKPIAMGYLQAELAQPGTQVEIDIRGQREPAVVVPRPFYRRTARKTGRG
jgi:aminomethyltransferase